MVGILAGLAFLITLLWGTPVVYPLKILVVFFHELSHGLMAILTGGQIVQIQLSAFEGGLCITAGGNRFLILSAGYVGSLLWGGVILLLAARTRWHRALTMALGWLLLVVGIAYVRPLLSFGLAFILASGAALLYSGLRAGQEFNRYLLKLIGLTSLLYAPLDILSDTIFGSHLPSDAQMLSQLTGIPTVVHGVVWIAVSVLCGFLLLVAACQRDPLMPAARRKR
ncbi:M50 family metallopeptidase [bacterium]|nr:M50 family metallopeptidase [bacterium]